MTHNIMRLSVTILLCLLFAWVFAVFGLLWFESFHVNEDGWGVRERNDTKAALVPDWFCLPSRV
jgi:hypothetical protein